MTTTATPLDIIKGSLRLLEVLSSDVILEAPESSDALQAFNFLLDSWSNESLTIWKVEQEVFSLIGGLNPHTWGIGGNFNSVRPMRLLEVKTRIVNNVDIPVRILSHDDYAAVPWKTIEASYPTYLYNDNAYPLANIYIWPVPTGTEQLVCYSEKPFNTPATLTQSLSMPPGYFRALKYNLAMELASEYQIQSSPDILRLANDSLSTIKRTNKKTQTLSVDPAVLRNGKGPRFNIYAGE